MEQPNGRVRYYGHGAVLQMETEKENQVVVRLFWQSGITKQPWSIISKRWIKELSHPPWMMKLDIDPNTPSSTKYEMLKEACRTYGESLLQHGVIV